MPEKDDAEYSTCENAPALTHMAHGWRCRNSGFYEWKSRPESATARRREILRMKITALFEANDSTYGYRRIHAALARGGEREGPELDRRLQPAVMGFALPRVAG